MIFLGECVPAWWYEYVLDMRDDVLYPESVFVLGMCVIANVKARDIHHGCFYCVCCKWKSFYCEVPVVIPTGFHFNFCNDRFRLMQYDTVGSCAY